jgi:hypothetical protein
MRNCKRSLRAPSIEVNANSYFLFEENRLSFWKLHRGNYFSVWKGAWVSSSIMIRPLCCDRSIRHFVHKLNAYRGGLICLSVCVFQLLENCWTDCYETLHERCAKIRNILFPTISSNNSNIEDARTYEVGATLTPLNIGSWNDMW